MPSSVGIVASGVGNAAVGQSLLLGMAGFWDARLYSGSGNWLNLGTGGSSGDLTPFGDVVYTASKFNVGATLEGRFENGVNATYHIPDKGSGHYSTGIVQQTNVGIFRNMWLEQGANNWGEIQDTPTKRVTGAVGVSGFNGPVSASYTKDLRGFYVNDTTHIITPHVGTTIGSTSPDSRVTTSAAGKICVSSIPGSGTWLPQDVHGAYIHQGLLTPANIADICAYFGV